ncbi:MULTISPECIES: hypothetical protein [unclassified Crossiella]|uniref:hypothetical protein n=1 Tax=unclassified Crossiella TaxID=2620835 RepID=UPI001FFE3153|nr:MULTISPECIES: hypothetical protein [unclassified Crossiella]MCK2243716.1 hypothetical protein [Crossiella sp. S99.2]MCK2257575.1 hypothetical protein [Crossiella sp. S99.1]
MSAEELAVAYLTIAGDADALPLADHRAAVERALGGIAAALTSSDHPDVHAAKAAAENLLAALERAQNAFAAAGDDLRTAAQGV